MGTTWNYRILLRPEPTRLREHIRLALDILNARGFIEQYSEASGRIVVYGADADLDCASLESCIEQMTQVPLGLELYQPQGVTLMVSAIAENTQSRKHFADYWPKDAFSFYELCLEIDNAYARSHEDRASFVCLQRAIVEIFERCEGVFAGAEHEWIVEEIASECTLHREIADGHLPKEVFWMCLFPPEWNGRLSPLERLGAKTRRTERGTLVSALWEYPWEVDLDAWAGIVRSRIESCK